MRQAPSYYANLFSQFSAHLGELLVTEQNPITRSEDYLMIADLSLALKFFADGAVSSPKTHGLPKCDSDDNAITIINSSLSVLFLMQRTLNDDRSASHNPELATHIKNLYDQLTQNQPFSRATSSSVVSSSSLFAAGAQTQAASAETQITPSHQGSNALAWLSLTGNQELCLTFSDSALRDHIYQTLIRSSGQQHIDSSHCSGNAFSRNSGGQTPVTYTSCPSAIYFPTYSADSSVTGCNFMCPMIRSSFLASLGTIGCREEDLFDPQLFSQAHQTFYDSQGNELAHTRAIGGSSEPNTCALFFHNHIFNQTIEIDMRQPRAGFSSHTTIHNQHHQQIAP